jgi:hypothetical protein
MEITNIETITEPGGSKENEDTFFVTGARFGVFDGASSLDGYTDEDGYTGAYLASHIAKDTFEGSDGLLVDIAGEANSRIRSAMEVKNIDTTRKESLWGCTMAAVDIDTAASVCTWAQVADSLIIFIYTDGTHKQLITEDYNHDRDVLCSWKKLADLKVEDIMSHLYEDVVSLRRTSNVSYGVLNGEPELVGFIRSGEESLENVAHVLVFTDGMMIPDEDPDVVDDFSKTVELFLRVGLTGVRDYIRSIENTDPNCLKYPRYKKSDDLTAIAVSLS